MCALPCHIASQRRAPHQCESRPPRRAGVAGRRAKTRRAFGARPPSPPWGRPVTSDERRSSSRVANNGVDDYAYDYNEDDDENDDEDDTEDDDKGDDYEVYTCCCCSYVRSGRETDRSSFDLRSADC